MTMKGKNRKKGDWILVARGRAARPAALSNGHGLSNIPSVTDVGSAAYRRLMASKVGRWAGRGNE